MSNGTSTAILALLIRKWRNKARHRAFSSDFNKFKELARARPELSVEWQDKYPCLDDKTEATGFDRHYVFHTAWAARILAETRPNRHIDFSSSLYFNAIASAFVSIDFFDFRPAELNLTNLRSSKGDLLSIPFEDKSVASLSCMHVIEHIGLGRYGDPMDAFGDLKAMGELKRVLAIDGTLLLVVPVGQPRVMFNAHRIYAYDQIIEYMKELTLIEFSLIPDDGSKEGLLRNANPALVSEQKYACGCFHFKRTRM